eukprot:TRINITY_DN9146_c0_g1_i1.p1 TRINITY_DN9146_c0_g1~~TRINITY_DN9146_c0_g1_i1.p1  ORF type:complete len:479 (+),score=125.87 TRINITY_DN9146_c0_g1_i1:287-1723(+)
MRALRLRGTSLGLEAHARAAMTIHRLGRMQADVHTLVATALEGRISRRVAGPHTDEERRAVSLRGQGPPLRAGPPEDERRGGTDALCGGSYDAGALGQPKPTPAASPHRELHGVALEHHLPRPAAGPSAGHCPAPRPRAPHCRPDPISEPQAKSSALERSSPVLAPAERHAAHLAMHVWAHFANALGLTRFKSDFEEMAFRLLHPGEHAALHRAMDTPGRRYERLLQDVTDALKQDLMKDPVLMQDVKGLQVTGRTKSPYSVWKKMSKKGLQFHEVLDKVALRVVLDVQATCDLRADTPDQCTQRAHAVCYRVQERVRTLWATLPEKAKDYIAKPKANGYQSLHVIAVTYTPEGHAVPLEVQIRSQGMDQQAEYGVAGHWQYKMVDGKGEARQTLKEACQQLFKEIDRDGSGVIDEAELALLLRRLGAPILAEEVATALRIFDKDGSGGIDFEEFWDALHTTWFTVTAGDLGKSRVLA